MVVRSQRPRVVVLFSRLGPYHAARVAAAARAFPTLAIEFERDTDVYAWDRVETTGRFDRVTLVPEGRAEDVGIVEFARRLIRTLEQVRPEAMALPGWSHPGSILALAWALSSDTPTIMMSESQERDAERRWWVEYPKSRIVRLCSSALVGGQRHVHYISSLGMRPDCIFTGYDVVDNDYFLYETALVRRRSVYFRAKLGLPDHFFLASSRFIKKKNLFGLLRAYRRYRSRAGADAFKLVILGDGPLAEEVARLRASLRLERDVLLPGFQQYSSLPAYYGLAEAFVHASTSEQWGLVVNEAMAAGLPVLVSQACGCVPELVHDGHNGFTFDPLDEAGLADLMLKVGGSANLRSAMGHRSRAIIKRFSPDYFAAQLREAQTSAERRQTRVVPRTDWVLLAALALRKGWRRSAA